MIAGWQVLLAVALGVFVAAATYALPLQLRDVADRFVEWRDDALSAAFGDDD